MNSSGQGPIGPISRETSLWPYPQMLQTSEMIHTFLSKKDPHMQLGRVTPAAPQERKHVYNGAALAETEAVRTLAGDGFVLHHSQHERQLPASHLVKDSPTLKIYLSEAFIQVPNCI